MQIIDNLCVIDHRSYAVDSWIGGICYQQNSFDWASQGTFCVCPMQSVIVHATSELADKGIRVNCVAPGVIKTKFSYVTDEEVMWLTVY